MKKLVLLTTLFWAAAAIAEVPVHEDRNEAEYNFQYAVTLDGHDPVSYFPEGGGSPVKGSASIAFTYGAITYYFADENNKNLFMKNPLKYEPTYGSWCAWAMSKGAKVEIKPLIYTIHGNRLHFFFSKSAKKSFDNDLANSEGAADENWKDFSGEEPRK